MLHERPVPHSDPLFDTEQKRVLVGIWDKMQRLQTDFAIAQELTCYYTSPQWRRAKTVLDLGTGKEANEFYGYAGNSKKLIGKTYEELYEILKTFMTDEDAKRFDDDQAESEQALSKKYRCTLESP